MIQQDVLDTLATLLAQTGMVKQADLVDARNIANDLAIPLDKALMMSGIISEASLALAQEARNMVDQKTLSLDLAIRALRFAAHNNTNLEIAVNSLAKVHKATQAVVSITNELTALLLAAKLITSEQLGVAVRHAADSKIMIGHTLIVLGFVPAPVVYAALNAVLMIRQKSLDKDQAAQGLRYAVPREITIEHALFELRFFSPPAAETLRLSELIHMAGLLTSDTLVECLEIELFKQKQFGQVLLEQGILTQTHLDAAIDLQGSVANETLKPFQAAFALRRVYNDNINVYQAMAEAQILDKGSEPSRLGDLLVAAEICSQETLEELVADQQASSVKIGKILLNAGTVQEAMLYNALRCQSLLRQGFLSRDDASRLLNHCKTSALNLDAAFHQVDINVPSRMQWLWV